MAKPEKVRWVIEQGSDRQLANMVVALFNRQIEDEKATNHTGHNNGVGFNKPDSGQLSIIAKWCIKHRHDKPFTLLEFQRAEIKKRLPKYAMQLAEISQQPNYQPLIPKP